MRAIATSALLVLAAAPLAAQQQNPFARLGSSVRSAHVVYDVLKDGKPVPGARAELGVSGDRLGFETVLPLPGQAEPMRLFRLEAGDTVYRQSGGPGEAEASLRRHLAAAYEQLSTSERERLRENAELFERSGEAGASELELLLTEPAGTETIAGQTCQVIRTGDQTVCTLPGSPGIALRGPVAGLQLVARSVTLNGPVPDALVTVPKGVRWRRVEGWDYGEFATSVWSMTRESDPAEVAPATLASEALRWLASPEAAELLGEYAGDEAMEDEPEADDAVADE